MAKSAGTKKAEKTIVPQNLKTPAENQLYAEIAQLLETARTKVLTAVNTTMTQTYYQIGKLIVENEQNGHNRAEYGKATLKTLSQQLTEKYGKGFSERNLERMRYFYLTYAPSITQTVSAQFTQESKNVLLNTPEQISQTLSAKSASPQISTTVSSKSAAAEKTVQIIPYQKENLSTRFKLSYSHYLFLMKIDNPDERTFYEKEAVNGNWSLRELKRQFDTALFERLLINKNPTERKNLIKQGHTIENPKDIIKDPYILEFLGLPEQPAYSETELEQHIIDKLQTFLLELGNGYTFVARQMRLTLDEKHYRIDLVFYNRILQCFVLIDLKLGEITHQDIGQMQMYVHYFDRYKKLETENKTIGIILCKKKDDTLVELTLPEDEKHIFASKYQTILPDKKQLAQLIKETEETSKTPDITQANTKEIN